MADNNKNIEILIEELINLTKENKINWKYTDDNKEISAKQRKILLDYDFIFNATDNCFYTKINSGYIIVIEGIGEPAKNYLIVIPSIDAKDFKIYDSPQSQIVRLHTLILRQFPNVEDYLTDVFKTLKTMST